jgi:hypothetical protein
LNVLVMMSFSFFFLFIFFFFFPSVLGFYELKVLHFIRPLSEVLLLPLNDVLKWS